jgi:hypothetical protein
MGVNQKQAFKLRFLSIDSAVILAFVGRAFMPAMLIKLGLRASAGMNARPTVHYL